MNLIVISFILFLIPMIITFNLNLNDNLITIMKLLILFFIFGSLINLNTSFYEKG